MTIPSITSKSRFGKITRRELGILFLTLFAGIVFSLGIILRESSNEMYFIAMLLASVFYICVVIIRSKSANDVQIQIDNLRNDIDELKRKLGNSNESKLNTQ